MVVSRQLENVLVEQNHCHGLTTVNANYTNLALVLLPSCRETIPLPRSYATTPRTNVAQTSKCRNLPSLRQRPALSEVPRRGIPLASREKNGGSGRANQPRDRRQQRAADATTSAIRFSIPDSRQYIVASTTNQEQAHPGQPRALPLSKRQLPRRLQRLVELIWLKKRAHHQRVQQPERNQRHKHRRIRRDRHRLPPSRSTSRCCCRSRGRRRRHCLGRRRRLQRGSSGPKALSNRRRPRLRSAPRWRLKGKKEPRAPRIGPRRARSRHVEGVRSK